MYARSQDRRPTPPVRLPEHYDGCAFSSSESPPPNDPLTLPSSSMSDRLSAPADDRTHALSTLSPRLLRNLGFEELLLLGLLLLLSQSDTGSDLLPLLALVLFCG